MKLAFAIAAGGRIARPAQFHEASLTSMKHARRRSRQNCLMKVSVGDRREEGRGSPVTTPVAHEHVALQAPLVFALRDSAFMHAPGDPVTVLEMSISYVLLTGQFAYKIKKAVNRDFLKVYRGALFDDLRFVSFGINVRFTTLSVIVTAS